MYVREISLEGRTGGQGVGGGAVGIAFKRAQCPQGLLRNGKDFSEVQGVRWSVKFEVSRYPILFPLPLDK